MPRFLLSVLIGALILAVVILILNNRYLRQELVACRAGEGAPGEAKAETGRLSDWEGGVAGAAGYANLTTAEADSLRSLGLADPVAALDSALRAHPELIPYEGVLGGTMGFHDPEGIRVLGPDRMAAVFDDGHQQGRMLVRYRVEPGGAIAFEVLEASL